MAGLGIFQPGESKSVCGQLADKIGDARDIAGDVPCFRPIVDAKWLEKPRQVGTSGQTVKPKVYMAPGISGSFQQAYGRYQWKSVYYRGEQECKGSHLPFGGCG
ncbi:FAD-binding protein [Desulfococcaceae bacterium HSG8]|nr:FAD-binding protein [Desulfococcaceae bacterium HSG8]